MRCRGGIQKRITASYLLLYVCKIFQHKAKDVKFKKMLVGQEVQTHGNSSGISAFIAFLHIISGRRPVSQG